MTVTQLARVNAIFLSALLPIIYFDGRRSAIIWTLICVGLNLIALYLERENRRMLDRQHE